MSTEFPASAQSAVRILVIDDHAAVAQMIGMALEALGGFRLAGQAGTPADGQAAAAALQPDIAILDLDLGGSDGLELLPLLRQACAKTRILVFTGHPRLSAIRRAMLAGADGMVEKTATLDEFLDALRSLACGKCYFSRFASEAIRRLVHRPGGSPRLVRLTQRDKALLRAIAEGRASKEISALFGLSEHTVVNRRTQLSKKLGIRGLANLTRYAISLGLVSAQIENAPEAI